ncbi:MAG: hypothetical protein KAQ91_04340 [Methylococcales bacterium]|nr:hypothetical protein [Methylococcales bacterium]
MNETDKDKGIILALLERFNTQRLPVAQALKKKVDSGRLLDESEHQQLYQVEEDLNKVRALIERNPEYKDLAAEILNLWTEIIQKEIENQKKQNN